MQRKNVLFVADSLDNAHKVKQVLSTLDVEAMAVSSTRFEALFSRKSNFDLVIYEVKGDFSREISQLEARLANSPVSALLVVDPKAFSSLHFPSRVKSDFVSTEACAEECTARVKRLLWPGEEADTAEVITVESMVINLATYQVTVGGTPLDLTYLEYALLSFLASHPNRTFTRDALLQRVWGFDYYGGSRTVDVHVRRIRAKLGPEMAQHLETVRGIGYLWSS